MTQKRLTLLRTGAAVLFLAAFLAYGVGLSAVFVSEEGEMCEKGLIHSTSHLRELRESFLPIRQTCVFEDGATHEVVPSWVNVVLFGGTAGSVACAVTARRAERSARASAA
ncbi:hypothetical protein ABZ707_22295 [Streptomyces sp. NPDC006923]|uniref:hypothetical protein n=1 Tax=Streptomyces sp. NPDC006923 TaxID=3155355 RepID=UPI0033EAB3C2